MLVLRDGVKRRTTAARWADSTTSSAVCRLEVDTRSVRATSFAEHDPPERLIGLDNLEATRRAGRGELVKLGALRPGHFSPIVHLMVNYSGTGLDSVFLALADSTRRGMIDRLSQGPATVGELGEPFPVTKPAITKHVRTLEEAGLIRRERVGRFHRCTLVPEALRRAEVWIERHRKFWESSLDRLTRHVETTSATSPHTGGRK